MPYGPGKFEGEGPETFILHARTVNGDQGDESFADPDGGGWDECFASVDDSIDADLLRDILGAGWTVEELQEGLDALASARRAILSGTSTGFVMSRLYVEDEIGNYEQDVAIIRADYESTEDASEV